MSIADESVPTEDIRLQGTDVSSITFDDQGNVIDTGEEVTDPIWFTIPRPDLAMSAAGAARTAVSNFQKYGSPLVQSFPGSASAISAGLYGLANYAQQMRAPAEDVALYTTAAAAINVAATNLSALGRSALSAARNPYVLLGALDAALAYGVSKEVVAAYQGKCH